jgi:uncharacterized membrane protein
MSNFSLGRAPLLYIICQAIVILFFGLFTEFKTGTDPKDSKEEPHATELLKDHYACF